jgi:hypothetical protein
MMRAKSPMSYHCKLSFSTGAIEICTGKYENHPLWPARFSFFNPVEEKEVEMMAGAEDWKGQDGDDPPPDAVAIRVLN